MNTKIIATLMASVMAISIVAMALPAMGTLSEATVNNVDPTIACADCPVTVDLNPETMVDAVNTTVWINGTIDDGNCYSDINNSVTCDASAFGVHVVSACSCVDNKISVTGGTFNCSFDLDGCTPEDLDGYLVNVTVTDVASASDTCGCLVYINENVGLELDFTTISYGEVNISEYKNIAGDNVWDLGAGNTAGLGVDEIPGTVHNMANAPMNVNITAADMTTGGGGEECKIIHAEELDANVDACGELELIESTPVEFGVCMGCCNLTNMDFSINVTHPVQPGVYAGSMVIEPAWC